MKTRTRPTSRNVPLTMSPQPRAGRGRRGGTRVLQGSSMSRIRITRIAPTGAKSRRRSARRHAAMRLMRVEADFACGQGCRMRFPEDVPTLTHGDVTLRAHRLEDRDAIVEQCTDPVSVQWTPCRWATRGAWGRVRRRVGASEVEEREGVHLRDRVHAGRTGAAASAAACRCATRADSTRRAGVRRPPRDPWSAA